MARNNNEAKIKFTAETKQFTAAVKDADRNMASLRAELKMNEAQMKATGTTVEGLETKHNLLNRQWEESKRKVEALQGKVDAATRTFGANSAEAQNWTTKLVEAQARAKRLEQAVNACDAELKAYKDAQKQSESATKQLTDTIEKQQREVDDLKDEYKEAVLQYGKTSDEAKDLARKLKDLSGELKNSKNKMDDAERAADKLDKSLDDAGDAAKNSGEGFTVMKGVVADLASSAIQMAIGKISEFIGYLAELPEATRELRQDMATLDTSFQRAGFSTEQATQTWKDLYTIFGEDDRAVEAANLISKMAKNEEDLNEWVTITAGVWGSYQDSLPVEGLAEASNETAKTGKVTGVLADALNWSSEAASMFSKYMSDDVTTAEDAFNEALKECTTEQERQALITDTLSALYGDAAAEYEKASGAQLAAKEATAENTLAQAEAAEAVEPATTAWEGLKTTLLVGITPALTTICNGLANVFGWLKEHPAVMWSLIAILGVLATALTVATIAQWAMNSAMLASPVTWIILAVVAAIAALIAIVVVVIKYWDQIKAACISAWEGIKSVCSTIGNWFNTNVIQPVVRFFTNLWTSIKNIWNNIVNVVKVAFMLLGSIISAAWNIITLPFRLIWENCKQYVFAAWEWIKTKVTAGINFVKNIVTTGWNAVKNAFTTAWNACKNVVLTVWNAIVGFLSPIVNRIKSIVTTAWEAVKTRVSSAVTAIKTKVSAVFDSVRTKVSGVFNSIKNTATNVWNRIKTAITGPIEAARDKVKSVIDAIKGFFSGLKLKLPKIKLPHFSIQGKLSLNPPSVPKLKIDWYAKGGIFTRPTIFNTATGLKGVGEAGAEAILPIDRLQGYIEGAIEKSAQTVDLRYLANAIEDLASRPIDLNINGRAFAQATAGDTDSVGGMRTSLMNRGLALA